MEFEGRSIEEAIEKAEAHLGRRPEEGEFEIVDDGRKGFLGIGNRMARIRLDEPPKREVSSTRSGGAGGRTTERPAGARGGSGRAPSRPRAASGRAGGAPAPARAASGRAGGEPAPARDDATGDEPPYSRHEAVREVAGKILREMKLDLTARLQDRDGSIILDLGGKDAHLLLEDDGEGLEALQHILNKILARDPRFETRVVTECEGFRSQRDADLVRRAERLAEEVCRSGRTMHLDGLNPYERRLIHLSLSEGKGVRTHSEGEGTLRRLKIEPLGPPSSGEGA